MSTHSEVRSKWNKMAAASLCAPLRVIEVITFICSLSPLRRERSAALVQSGLMSPPAPVTFGLKGYFSLDTD